MVMMLVIVFWWCCCGGGDEVVMLVGWLSAGLRLVSTPGFEVSASPMVLQFPMLC